MKPILSLLIWGGMMAMAQAATQEELAQQKALWESLCVTPQQLKPLHLETPLVQNGEGRALICTAAHPAWQKAAQTIQQAIAAATGVTLSLVTDETLAPAEFLQRPTILLGHLNNNRYVARLYHNFFVCCDEGFTGRTGYEIRSIHNPFGTGHNAIFVGGSFAEGTQRAAEAFAALCKAQGRPGELTLGRLLELKFDPQERQEQNIAPLTPAEVTETIARYQKAFQSPGEGRTGASGLVRAGINFHRSGDPGWGQAYKGLMAALLDYYRTDKYINEEGMRRYDNDFRDAWTFQVAILWDLLEESGLFSDQERLEYTNLVLRLGLECFLYQGYDRPEVREKWRHNTHIVHNHNTFPALGLLFIARYMQRHYQAPWAEEWLAIVRGIFNGLKHTSKPMEDAASYQWLPLMHCAIYSLAEEDRAFFEEGHCRQAAWEALQVMDNAGYQAAFGDHSEEMGSSGLGDIMQMAAWHYRDPELLWGARRTSGGPRHPLGQLYALTLEPQEPKNHIGIVVSPLPRPNYEDCAIGTQYRTTPNVPYELTFNKLSLRAGWDPHDEYVLLDGFGRGNHMHFDANAIIRYARGGVPLLCDGEYIKNAPKYHNSLVLIRDGQAELTPAVTRLDRADMLQSGGCTQTTLVEYNGADWTRTMLWRPHAYLLVVDEVQARKAGDYTLRCCWRPWGRARLQNESLVLDHPPMRLEIRNLSGQPALLETLKQSGALPVSRFAEQISLPLQTGQNHRFVNMIVSGPAAQWPQLEARYGQPGIVVIRRGDSTEIACLGDVEWPGLRFSGAALILGPESLIMFGARRLTAGSVSLTLSTPASVELYFAQGQGLLISSGDGEGRLELGSAGPPQQLRFGAGRHTFAIPPGPLPEALQQALRAAAAQPDMPPPLISSKNQDAKTTPLAWEAEGFRPLPQALTVADVSTTPEPLASRGPVSKLFDGQYSSSAGSVMWPAGKTAVINVILPQETDIHSVVLREWHMNENWAIGERKLELSSDGFQQDIRRVSGVFVETGTQSFGSNVNTIFELAVGQKAQQLRVTLTPANENCSVYLAEMEIRGLQPGRRPAITAIAAGDLNGDGQQEIIIASEEGQIMALNDSGAKLWEYTSKERARMNCLACADVNGDGRAEIMFGQDNETLGLISGAGELLWATKPPRFRGLPSDITTIFPGDINGDGRPEIIAGAKSWQYFAYAADGQMRWSHIIYAHAATVGYAADLNGDRKEEIVAGNAYYRLNVISAEGKIFWRQGNIGPEMTAVYAADITGDGQPEVFAGVDGGTLHAYSATGQTLWEINLGDKITRLLACDVNDDGRQELICAAESASLFALDAAGKIVWRAALPDGCSDFVISGQGEKTKLVACCGRAGVAMFNRQGKLLSNWPLAAQAENLVVTQNVAAVVLSEGKIVGIRLPE